MQNRKPASCVALGVFVSFLAIEGWGQQSSRANSFREEERDLPGERGRYFTEPRAFPLGYIPGNARLEALRHLDRMLELQRRSGPVQPAGRTPGARINSTQWTAMGARPLLALDSLNTDSGRVTSLAVDPRSADTVYAGAAAGGVWKTTDGGRTWTPLGDEQPSLAIGSLALDPQNPNIVYAGTGELNFGGDNYSGVGILKSTDGGGTWSHLAASTFTGPLNSATGGARIGSLSVHPTNSQVLLAAVSYFAVGTDSGIYRSDDGGVSWKQTLEGAAGTEVAFDPANGATAYAAIGATRGSAANGFYKSTDGGVTWSLALPSGVPRGALGRIEFAVAPSQPSTIYLSLSGSGTEGSTFGSILGVFKSSNSGAAWSELAGAPDYCAPQCWYDNVVRVHPANPNLVVMGGSGADEEGAPNVFHRSTDGGATWQEVSVAANNIRIHADLQTIAFSRDGSRLYVGCDGGVYSTTDVTAAAVAWTSLNAGLNTIQYYPNISVHPVNPNFVLAGAQDNGTQIYRGDVRWDRVTCGDGGWTNIDFNNPAIMYASCQNIDIRKSTRNGDRGTWTRKISGITTADRRRFIPPFVMDPGNSARLYLGTFRLWQTSDGAESWTAISDDLTGGTSTLSAIAVAPGNANVVYVGALDGSVQRSSNATGGAATTFTNIREGLPTRSVNQIAVDPQNADIAYVAFSGFSGFTAGNGHVFRTTDGGRTWANITGTLPNAPVNDVLVDPDLAGTLYVATDAGVFRTTNLGGTWSPFMSGLPRVPMIALRLHRPSRFLRAASHGRGMWEILAPAGGNPPQLSAGGTINGASFKAPVAPGMIAAVFGQRLGSELTFAAGVPLPTFLAGVSLNFGGTLAVPIFFAAPGQMNVQIPWEIAGQTSATLTATNAAGASAGIPVAIAPAAPAIFSTNQQGTGQGVVLIASSGEIAAPTGSIQGRAHRPANKGEFLTIYCLGLGDVDNRPATGASSPAAEPLARVRVVPTVTIGGANAEVSFAGLAPGFVGLYQVNVRISENTPSGPSVDLVITSGGVASNTVTIAVQ